jgi:hypothetical protein
MTKREIMIESKIVERLSDYIAESKRLSEVIKTKQLIIAELDFEIEQKRRML